MEPAGETPADVLAAARKQLEAMKALGLTPDMLMELWNEDAAETGQVRASWHQPRSSVSSTSSSSSGKASIFSTTSKQSFDSVATFHSGRGTQDMIPTPPVPSLATANGANIKIEPPSSKQHELASAPLKAIAALPSSGDSNGGNNGNNGSTTNHTIAAGSTAGATGGMCVPSHVPTHSAATLEKRFWCTSCDAGFRRKFDWKRHEEEFHERWKKYPCPDCNRAFWGANTFNQHHKSAHGCKTCPHADRVVKYLRRKKAWGCGFCGGFVTARDRYFEHVSKHFELGNTKADWLHSLVVYGLLHQPVIHEAWKRLCAQRHGPQTNRQPNFSWSPASTGRAQGFMENECPGQLQDLLEFFSGSAKDAEILVQYAYDQADVFLRPRAPSPPIGPGQSSPPQQQQPSPPQQQQQQPQPEQQASQWDVYNTGAPASNPAAEGPINNQSRFSFIQVGPRAAALTSRFSLSAQQAYPAMTPGAHQHHHMSLSPQPADVMMQAPTTAPPPPPPQAQAMMHDDFLQNFHQHHPHLPTNVIDKELPLPPRPPLEVLPEEDYMSYDGSPTDPTSAGVVVGLAPPQTPTSHPPTPQQPNRPQLQQQQQQQAPVVPDQRQQPQQQQQQQQQQEPSQPQVRPDVEDWESFATTMVDDAVGGPSSAPVGVGIPGVVHHHLPVQMPVQQQPQDWEMVHYYDAHMVDPGVVPVHHMDVGHHHQHHNHHHHHLMGSAADVTMSEAHLAA